MINEYESKVFDFDDILVHLYINKFILLREG